MPVLNGLKIAVSCSSNMNRSMEAHAILSKKGFYVKSFGTGEKVKLPGTAPDRPNVYEFGCTYEEIYQDLLGKDKTYYTQNGLLHMLDRNRRIKLGPERFQSCPEKFDIIITCEERVYDQVVEFLESREGQDNTPVHIINIDIQDNHEEATLGAFLVCELVQAVFISAYDSQTFIPYCVNINVTALQGGCGFCCSFCEIPSIEVANPDFWKVYTSQPVKMTFLLRRLMSHHHHAFRTSLIPKLSESEDLDNEIDEVLHEFESRSGRSILHCLMFY